MEREESQERVQEREKLSKGIAVMHLQNPSASSFLFSSLLLSSLINSSSCHPSSPPLINSPSIHSSVSLLCLSLSLSSLSSSRHKNNVFLSPISSLSLPPLSLSLPPSLPFSHSLSHSLFLRNKQRIVSIRSLVVVVVVVVVVASVGVLSVSKLTARRISLPCSGSIKKIVIKNKSEKFQNI